MADAAQIGEHTVLLRSFLRRLGTAVATLLGMSVLVGALLLLLAETGSEDAPSRTASASAATAVPTAIPAAIPAATSLPYGGALDRPDPDDLIDAGSLMGLGLLGLGATNGLVFAFAATFDAVRGPSAAETRRRLRHRHDRGVVPGGRREGARTVRVPAAPCAPSDPLAVIDIGGRPARRSVPGRAAAGTTYASAPSPHVPEPAPRPVFRPSPVPRDGGPGGGRPSPAADHDTGPWGWRPARPDPVPWRNTMPWPALAGAH